MRKNIEISEKIVKQIISDYKDNFGTRSLSNKYCLGRGIIKRVLKENNIPSMEYKSLLKCNRDFFLSYTKESCYWAGFILADGNLIQRTSRALTLQIGLSNKDKNHLIKFLNSLSCEDYSRVKTYSSFSDNRKPSCWVAFNFKEFADGLTNNFDIYPNKTGKEFISPKIPEQFLSHFIRGFFDGDGHITKDKFSMGFTGCETILKQISDYFLSLNLITKKFKINYNHSKVVGSARKTGIEARNMLKHIYTDSTENTRLARKFIIYSKYLEFFNEKERIFNERLEIVRSIKNLSDASIYRKTGITISQRMRKNL